jgi:hypothetical protein
MKIEVYNVFGQIVYQVSLNQNQKNTTLQINLNAQPSGVYLVKLIDGHSVTNYKVIKE